jgi:hypothetical protein
VAKADHLLSNGTFESIVNGAYDLVVEDATESIVYTTLPAKLRSRSNMCRHVKSLTKYMGDPGSSQRLTFFNVGHVNHYTEYTGFHSHATISHASAVAIAMGVSQLNVASTPTYFGDCQVDMDNAYINLKPDLTALSLPNFLLELDDVGKLFQVWKSKVGTVKNVAGAHLNYNFGWKPFLSDIREMIGVLTGVLDKIEAFKRAANVTSRSHYTMPSTSTYKSGNFTYSSIHTCYWSGTVKRTKKAELIYRPKPFQVTGQYELMLRAYLDALGFELNPRIIWDALPFTFVLDWFFGIGSWLERHKYDTLELPFLYVDSNICFKEILQVESRLKMTSTTANPTAFFTPPSVTSRQFFTRIPVGPSENVSLTAGWKLPSLHQAELLVSLATVLSRSR